MALVANPSGAGRDRSPHPDAGRHHCEESLRAERLEEETIFEGSSQADDTIVHRRARREEQQREQLFVYEEPQATHNTSYRRHRSQKRIPEPDIVYFTAAGI